MMMKNSTKKRWKETWKKTTRFFLEETPQTKRLALYIGVCLFVVSLIGMTWSRPHPIVAKATPPETKDEDIRSLVEKVARHIVVKTGEEPTIATVENPDALRAQNTIFYQDAKIGDRLFIWTDKAVLYSPETDRILSVLPINYPAPPSPPVATTK